jgi:hypothetical protein
LIPDTFAIGLLLFGLALFFAPLLRMAGIVAVVAAIAYWLVMIAVRLAYRR